MSSLRICAAVVLLGACDSEKSVVSDETGAAETETDSGSTGGETGEPASSSSSGSTGGEPVEDFGREGLPCAPVGAHAPCQAEGVPGLEFCFTSPFERDAGATTWSVCLTEPCAEQESKRECGTKGQQICIAHDLGEGETDLRWGVCNDYFACELGDTEDCPAFDPVPCLRDGQGTQEFEECPFTPLVLSFGASLEFTPAPVRAADFSLRGSDACARADWPAPATPWLVLDRDGDGAIDDGGELFGNGTRLRSGSFADNGFTALAELDSDGDGALTPADTAWPALLLWADHDADRRSSGWELLPLTSFEIESIDLDYTRARDCDARGNCGVERSTFRYNLGNRSQRGEVIDVHLTCE